MEAGEWNEVIGGKRYRTVGSVEIASDAYWNGHNWERRGRNQFLFRTVLGGYFTVTRTRWQGERDTLTPLTQDEAITAWEELTEHLVTFEEAFPGVEIRDA